jgi:N-acetylglucosaminyldiphosphoundecaprenol N-acetyl-beta-D-mannosaminyltransferase
LIVALGVMSVGTSFDLDATVMLLVSSSLAMMATAGSPTRPSPQRDRPVAGSSSPGGEAPTRPREYRMLGVRVSAMTVQDWVGAVRHAVASGERCLMVGQNLHSVFLAHRDARLRALQERADHVRIDGLPLVWMGRSLGLPLLPEHRSGFMDLFDPLFREAQAGRWRVYFLGSTPATCARALQEVGRRYPGVALAGADGYFDMSPASPGNAERLAAIRAFAPDVLIVGMGMPRQEAWMLANVDRLDVPAVVACGACMEYVAGTVRAAPRVLSRLGLEWLFRLAVEPRRLASRYLVEPWFVLRLWCRDVGAALRRRGGAR